MAMTSSSSSRIILRVFCEDQVETPHGCERFCLAAATETSHRCCAGHHVEDKIKYFPRRDVENIQVERIKLSTGTRILNLYPTEN